MDATPKDWLRKEDYRPQTFEIQYSGCWSTLAWLFGDFCAPPTFPLRRRYNFVYLITNVSWRCTLVCLVYQQTILVTITLSVEGNYTQKPIPACSLPSLYLFEMLSAITLILATLIGYIYWTEVGVCKPTLLCWNIACSLVWFRSGYYLVLLIVLCFSRAMVN